MKHGRGAIALPKATAARDRLDMWLANYLQPIVDPNTREDCEYDSGPFSTFRPVPTSAILCLPTSHYHIVPDGQRPPGESLFLGSGLPVPTVSHVRGAFIVTVHPSKAASRSDGNEEVRRTVA